MMHTHSTILGSVLSEKAYALNQNGAYVVKVAKTATKSDVRRALKTIFNVDVIAVNTLITRSKFKRKMKTKNSAPIYVKSANVKKAIVRLKSGQTLPLSIVQKNEAKSS